MDRLSHFDGALVDLCQRVDLQPRLLTDHKFLKITLKKRKAFILPHNILYLLSSVNRGTNVDNIFHTQSLNFPMIHL